MSCYQIYGVLTGKVAKEGRLDCVNITNVRCCDFFAQSVAGIARHGATGKALQPYETGVRMVTNSSALVG